MASDDAITIAAQRLALGLLHDCEGDITRAENILFTVRSSIGVADPRRVLGEVARMLEDAGADDWKLRFTSSDEEGRAE
jgi:hypothetical protein